MDKTKELSKQEALWENITPVSSTIQNAMQDPAWVLGPSERWLIGP